MLPTVRNCIGNRTFTFERIQWPGRMAFTLFEPYIKTPPFYLHVRCLIPKAFTTRRSAVSWPTGILVCHFHNKWTSLLAQWFTLGKMRTRNKRFNYSTTASASSWGLPHEEGLRTRCCGENLQLREIKLLEAKEKCISWSYTACTLRRMLLEWSGHGGCRAGHVACMRQNRMQDSGRKIWGWVGQGM
jgi:hypothetical protein